MNVKLIRDDEPEVMGLFGFSWQEKVAAFMQKRLKGTAKEKLMKSFWQAGGKNVTLVNNLYNEYAAFMAKGQQPATFSVLPNAAGDGGEFSDSTISLASMLQKKTNVDTGVILEFFRAIFVLARDGKIPSAKWNPQGWKESTALRKSFSTEKGFGDVLQKSENYSKALLMIAGLGVGAYLLSQIKGLKP